jgi:hypothetical protein
MMKLGKMGKRALQVSRRLIANEARGVANEAEYQRGEISAQEYLHQKVCLEVERDQSVLEMNTLFRAERLRYQPLLVYGRPITRRWAHWNGEEKRDLARRIKRLLSQVQKGLTVHAIFTRFNVTPRICRDVLQDLVARGDLRCVKITVVFGNGARRKMEGYALPLRAVRALRRAA